MNVHYKLKAEVNKAYKNVAKSEARLRVLVSVSDESSGAVEYAKLLLQEDRQRLTEARANYQDFRRYCYDQ